MALTRANQFFKRLFDLTCSVLLLVALSPLVILIAMAVKITSPGEVFYRQQRLGRNGEIFWMYKFRSMIPNAVNIGSGMFLEKDDPRITPVGKLLRKTSLDELPQLLNIIRGEMSLVGPRPAPLHHLDKYDAGQRRRLAVKPGITGWAQVRGRLALYWPERIQLDIWYVENYSFWLDLRILAETIPVVFSRRGGTAQEDRKEVDPFMKM